jgi:RHS repeat-associated protein
MLLPNRHESSNSYRYGFNGMVKDDEVFEVEGSSYNTHFRQYDSRIARWKSTDPRFEKYPHLSPYSSFANNPLLFIDTGGDTIVISLIDPSYEGDAKIYAASQNIVKEQVNDGVFIVVSHGNPNLISDQSEGAENPYLSPKMTYDMLSGNQDYQKAKEENKDLTVIFLGCNTATNPLEHWGDEEKYSKDDKPFAQLYSDLEPNATIVGVQGYTQYNVITKNKPKVGGATKVGEAGVVGIRREKQDDGGLVTYKNGKRKNKFIVKMAGIFKGKIYKIDYEKTKEQGRQDTQGN